MVGDNLNPGGDYSARRYVEFFDSLPAPLFRTTIEGKLVYCNQALASLMGFDSAVDLIDYPVIKFYRNKKDRGHIIHAVIQTGEVFDLPVALHKKDGTPILCAITAKAIFDDDGNATHLDGVLKQIMPEIDSNIDGSKIDGLAGDLDPIVINFDLCGALINVNSAAEAFFGLPKTKLLGKSLSEFIAPSDRDLFPVFLADILKIGRGEIILSILDGNSKVHHLKCQAYLIKNNGRAKHIKCISKNVTRILRQRQQKAESKKFQGVLEMAGGVAHRLNQPLTIINNQINEILTEFKQDRRLHAKIVRIHNQIKKMNDITDKLNRIKKYEAMEYVAGIRIVDIEKSSFSQDGKEDR